MSIHVGPAARMDSARLEAKKAPDPAAALRQVERELRRQYGGQRIYITKRVPPGLPGRRPGRRPRIAVDAMDSRSSPPSERLPVGPSFNAFGDHVGGCYTCAYFGERLEGDTVKCAKPGDEHVRAQAHQGCAFWQREPGTDDS